jgi:ketosteroid isomerase-like protein
MATAATDNDLIATAKEYFRRGDAGRADLVDLFTDDVQIYFPKFGIGKGKEAIAELAGGLMGALDSIAHDIDSYLYHPSGNHLTVEGTTRGVAKNGLAWSGGETAGGRFCSVFEFRDGLIARMHIYMDPDYVSEDRGRFLWGVDGRRW